MKPNESFFSLVSGHGRAIELDTEKIHRDSIDWASAFGIAHQGNIAKLEANLVGAYIANVFENAGGAENIEALQIAVDWTLLFFCLDDYIEAINDISELRQFFARLLGVFKENKKCEEREVELMNPLSQALSDIRDRMSRILTADQMTRFKNEIIRLFFAFLEEAEYRIDGTTPTLDVYSGIRASTIGLKTGFVIGEAVRELDSKSIIFGHQKFRQMARACCLAVGYHNDLLTYKRELEDNEVSNAVIILIREGKSLEDAVEIVTQLHEEALNQIMHLASEMSHSGPVKEYVDILVSFVATHFEWSRKTGRYDRANAA